MTVAAAPDQKDDPEVKPVIMVRPSSNVQSTAHVVASSILEDRKITLRAIGAGAVNQAVKATVLARQQLAARGEDLVVKPGMIKVDGAQGDEVTAVVLICVLL